MTTSRTLGGAVAEYLSHCEARGQAEGTIKSRRVTLGQFLRVVGDINPRRVEGRHVDKFFTAFDWRDSTANNKVAHLDHFFRFLRARGYISRDRDPMFGFGRRTVPEVVRTRVPRTEWGRLLDACRTPAERLVIASGLYLFLRASEQQGLRVRDLDLPAYEVDVYRKKTKKWDRMPITAELEPHIREHLEWYSSRVQVEPDYFLIPGGTLPKQRQANGRLIAGTGLIDPTKPFSKPHQVVKRVLFRAGYPTYFEGEHTLRRSGARAYFDHLAQDGYPHALRRVQAMLGHKDSKTTEIYLGLDVDRHTRNEDLRGQFMFPPLDASNVTRLEVVSGQA